jgi:hypothetical protein
MKAGSSNLLYSIGLLALGLSLLSYIVAHFIGGSNPFIETWRKSLWALIALFPIPLLIALLFDPRLAILQKSSGLVITVLLILISVFVLPFAVTTESLMNPVLILVTVFGVSCLVGAGWFFMRITP